jgi:hypothetical protein
MSHGGHGWWQVLLHVGMQPDVCHHGAPGRSGAFRPAPGAVSGAGGQGGRRIPEGRIAGAVIRDRGGGGVAAAMAEQSQQQPGSGTAPEAGRSLYFPMWTILLTWILLMQAVLITQNSTKSALIGRVMRAPGAP